MLLEDFAQTFTQLKVVKIARISKSPHVCIVTGVLPLR